MTKNRVVILICLMLIAIFNGRGKRASDQSSQLKNKTRPQRTIVVPEVVKIVEPDFVREPANTPHANTFNPSWQKNLVASLKAQGGETVKSIEIKPIKSLVWHKDNIDLLAE